MSSNPNNSSWTTLDVAIPKLRKGTHLREWLYERRKRAESALITDAQGLALTSWSMRRVETPAS